MSKGMLKRGCVNSALRMLSFIILSFSGQNVVLAVEVTSEPLMLLAQVDPTPVDPTPVDPTPVGPTGAAQPNNAVNLNEVAEKESEAVVDVPVKDEASMLDDFQFSLAPVEWGG
ncbi:MAG: hypothetical protein ABL858_06310, partial [Candidatus Nitrotoga sp.]